MLSRVAAHSMMQRGLADVLKRKQCNQLQNVIFKRDSGHNLMPHFASSWTWMNIKNWAHFYFILSSIPVTVGLVIINIRMNPELIEVPDGYEPRHWEYEKHPISRFMSKYCYVPPEREQEVFMGLREYVSEDRLILQMSDKIKRTMNFYKDHRSRGFDPGLAADRIRARRDEHAYTIGYIQSLEGDTIETAYDPNTKIIAAEGYPDGPTETMKR